MRAGQAGETPARRGSDRTAGLLFAASLLVYLATRLWDLERFPIYFFCDEAVHTARFIELMHHAGRAADPPHELLPTYFANGGMLNLSLSVYVQGLVSLLVGPSVFAVRATTALASLSGAVALALSLRRIFQVSEWWSVVAFLTVLPCWFLHSRTGFETALMVSSYCWFFYFYLRYRQDHPGWGLAALAAGAAVFYSYAPGQGVIGLTGLLLLVTDFRYHWSQRAWLPVLAALGLALATPYARFRLGHPEMLVGHLKALNSYWALPISLGAKLLIFLRKYAEGFSPHFWFAVEGDGAIRHMVPGFAYLPALLVPFALLGCGLCVRQWRSSAHRLVLIAVLAGPFSSALVQPGITRVLSLIVPFSICCALGFSWLMQWICLPSLRLLARGSAWALLGLTGFSLLGFAVQAGPTFYRYYGLYGLQWGAQALFRDLIPRHLKADSGANVLISPLNFNSPEVFPVFFGWMNEWRVSFATLAGMASGAVLPAPRDFVVLTAEEFNTLPTCANISRFELREKIAYPDGQAAYYLGHIHFKPDFVAEVLRQPDYQLQPVAERAVSGGVPFSLLTRGAMGPRGRGLFDEPAVPVSSRLGAALNFELHFDQPVLLEEIQAEADADPLTVISIWGLRANRAVVTAIGRRGQPLVTAAAKGVWLDSVRVELSASPDRVVQLRRLRLKAPAPPSAP